MERIEKRRSFQSDGFYFQNYETSGFRKLYFQMRIKIIFVRASETPFHNGYFQKRINGALVLVAISWGTMAPYGVSGRHFDDTIL